MNEFNPLEKVKIDNRLPKKIINQQFYPNDSEDELFEEIKNKEYSFKDRKNNLELNALYDLKAGQQIRLALDLKNKIEEIDRKIDHELRFTNDKLKYEIAITELENEKENLLNELRKILGGN